MTAEQIIMGWKDSDYRAGLGDATLPACPAGAVELADPMLHPGGGRAPGSGRNFIWFIHIVSARTYCSVYGDNLWHLEL